MDSLEQSPGDVPPLTEFFEMVHIGDVIQQMVQLYYDERIVSQRKRLWVIFSHPPGFTVEQACGQVWLFKRRQQGKKGVWENIGWLCSMWDGPKYSGM